MNQTPFRKLNAEQVQGEYISVLTPNAKASRMSVCKASKGIEGEPLLRDLLEDDLLKSVMSSDQVGRECLDTLIKGVQDRLSL